AAASRISCANNLKQLGVAAHNYHSTYDRLSPGYLGPLKNNESNGQTDSTRAPYLGVLVFLLPYLEQDNLYRLIDTNPGTYWYNPSRPTPSDGPPSAGYAPNADFVAAQYQVNSFICPDNAGNPSTLLGVWAANHTWNSNATGATNPSPIGGYWGPYIYSGGTN